MAMQLLTDKYHDQLDGVVHCYDRIIVTSSLQPLCYPQGMTRYLYEHQIKIFDYAQKFAEPLHEQIIQNAEQLAQDHNLQIEFIRQNNFRKEDRIQAILKERGRQPGLVHSFSALERCEAYRPWHDKSTQHTFVRRSSGKCLTYYFYFIDAQFGIAMVAPKSSTRP